MVAVSACAAIAFVCKNCNFNFCLHYCSWQLLPAPSQLAMFVCTIAIHPFSMFYYNWHFLHPLFHMTTFVCTIAIENCLCIATFDNYCIHLFKLKIFIWTITLYNKLKHYPLHFFLFISVSWLKYLSNLSPQEAYS